jgi:hypothetical protein
MSKEAGTLERLILTVSEALQEVAARLRPENVLAYLDEFGVRVPEGFLTGAAVSGPLGAAETAAKKIAPVIEPLRTAIDLADSPVNAAAAVAAGVAAVTEIVGTIAALRDLSEGLTQAAAGIADADVRASVEAFAAEVPRIFLERLLLERIDALSARAVSLVALTGIADDSFEMGDPDDPLKPPYHLRRLHLDRVAKLADDPRLYLRDVFGWGAPDFDGAELFKRVARWLQVQGIRPRVIGPEDVEPADPPALDLGPFRLQADPSQIPPGLALVVHYGLADAIERETPLGSSEWRAYTSSKSSFEAGLRAVLWPDGRFEILPIGGPTISARIGIRLERADGEPTVLLGLSGGTRLEARKVDLALSLEGLDAKPVLQLQLEQLNCVVDVGGGDSFLKSISGGGRGRSDVSVGASWSPATGLRFTGSTALELAIPAHARIGPATLETVYVISNFKGGGAIPLELSAAIGGTLGPFTASVDRVGIEFKATFPEEGGNLGPAQLDTRFKPPSGVGLKIDGGGFSGGGFLRIDPDGGEYSGTLELQFQDVIHVTAVAVLNTKLPDGGAGFSLVLVISAEFAPIQLSFGFTLLGVGGMLGVNRTALYEQLRLGVRDGSLKSILFPTDVVANAPRIISDLKRIFPPQNGRVLIGPMGKLGWGTPTIVRLELGIILEIPRPGFVILGVLRVAMPGDDAPILNLQVTFLGIIDFEKRQLTFDASLFDSRLLTFTLTGDMAIRLYWGENSNFLMTAGGFHPAYTPPPMGLPQLNRLAIVIFQGQPSLRAEAYFAVTSNTVQFGAKVELSYGVKVFKVYGFIALDALIQFHPFHFIAQIVGSVAVKSGGTTLFSIRLDLMLEGPTPWHAKGRGSFEVGFVFTITISVGFEATFGEARNTSMPPVSVLPLIEAALTLDDAWRAVSDARLRQFVAARELPADSGVVIPPTGALSVAQRVAPLNIRLARLGPRRVEGASTFSIVNVSMGGDPAPSDPVKEQFAAAQFFDMDDAEKLSRRSFEPFDAGVEIAGTGAPRADFQRHIDVIYEVIYFRKPRRPILFGLRDALLDLLVRFSAAGRCKASPTPRAPTGVGTPKVVLPAETFVVAGIDDLEPHAPAVFTTESAAIVAMKDMVRKDARLAGKLQVVGSYEAAA